MKILGALTKVPKLLRYPPVAKAVGYLSNCPFYNLKYEYGTKEEINSCKGKKKGPWFFIKRHILLNGVFGGILAGFAWLFTGQVIRGQSQGEQQQSPSFLMSAIKNATGILALGLPALAYLGKYNFLDAFWVGGERFLDRAIEKAVSGDKPLFQVLDNKKLEEKATNSKLRFNKKRNGQTEDEEKKILSLADQPVGQLKAIFIGPPGTGKTEAMHLVCGEIVKNEGADKVIVERLDFSVLADWLFKKDSGGLASAFSETLEATGEATAADIVNAFAQSRDKLQTLRSTFNGTRERAKQARKEGKRLIVQMDEIDTLLGRLLGDKEMLEMFGREFQNFLEDSNVDFLFATNAENPEDIFDLKGHEVPDSLRGAISRLDALKYRVSAPTAETQAEMIAAYLLSLPDANMYKESSTKPKLDDLLDGRIMACVRGKNKEKTLTQLVLRTIVNPERRKKGSLFHRVVGRNVYEAISKRLPAELKVERRRKSPNVRISLEDVRDVLRSQEESYRRKKTDK